MFYILDVPAASNPPDAQSEEETTDTQKSMVALAGMHS